MRDPRFVEDVSGVKLRAILWDYDGTLLNSCKLGMERCIQLVADRGFEVREDIREFLIRNRHWNKKGVLMLMDGFGLGESDAQRIYGELELLDQKDPCPLVDGAENQVKLFYHGGYFNGILSNRNQISLQCGVDHHEITELFEFISGVGDARYQKPDPRAFNDIMKHFKKLRIKEVNCIYVTDTPEDIECANKRGMDSLAVLTGFNTREDFLEIGVPPENILASVADVFDHIESLAYSM